MLSLIVSSASYAPTLRSTAPVVQRAAAPTMKKSEALPFMEEPAHLAGMVSRERLPFSLAYVSSLCLTIYSCIVAKSYLMTMGSAIFQVAALMWYGASFLPGGKYGMKIFTMMFLRAVRNMAGPCFNVLKATCKCCFRQSSLLPT